MPEVDALAVRYADRPDVLVAAVATGSADRVGHLREERAPHVLVPHATEAWTTAMGVTAFPETLLVDEQGRVAERIPHGTDLEYLAARVDALLAEAAGEVVVPPDRAAPKIEGHRALFKWIFAVESVFRSDPAPDPFSWTAHARKRELVLRLDVPRGTHVYRDELDVTVDDAGGDVFGQPVLPDGEIVADDALGPRERYDHDVVVRIPVSGPAADVRLTVRHQGCRGDLCYAPRTVPIRVRTR